MILDGDYDVFGDGTVVVISTPGHTPGHQSLFVKFKKTGAVVLSGDLYHYPAERTLKDFTPFAALCNPAQEVASKAKIEALLKEKKAKLWIQHDIVANAELKKSPAYYEQASLFFWLLSRLPPAPRGKMKASGLSAAANLQSGRSQRPLLSFPAPGSAELLRASRCASGAASPTADSR
jgi:glyoxylase-like metal-dependent hydrolase (beta-lactamase superfamily II)